MDGEDDLKQVVVGFFGPHQHGKSWTAGTILYENSVITPIQVINYKNACIQQIGRPESDWPVLIFDWTKEERDRKRTLSGDKFRFLRCGGINCEFVVLDSPGFAQYKSSMVRNASQVDLPVIVIWPERFEESIPEIIDTLHLLLGISIAEGVIIYFSRTDYSPISPERLEVLQTKIQKIVKTHSPFEIYKFCSNTKHLTGTLTEIGLDVYKKLAPKRYPESGEFIFPIYQRYRIFGIGTVVCGRPVSGAIKANTSETIFLLPTKLDPKKVIVRTIEAGHRPQNETKSNFVGINVKNLSPVEIQRAILTNIIDGHEDLISCTCLAKIRFVYSRQLFQHKITILEGYTATFFNVARSKATLQIENKTKLKKKGQQAIVHLRLNRPTAMTTFQKNRHLGKFIVVDHCHVIAIGKIIGVNTFNFLDSFFVWFVGMKKDEKANWYGMVHDDIMMYICWFVLKRHGGGEPHSHGGSGGGSSPKKLKLRKRACSK